MQLCTRACLDRPNPEEEYVEAAVEGEANKVKWEEVKVEPNYADKVVNNNDEFFVWIIVNKSKQWIEILRKVCYWSDHLLRLKFSTIWGQKETDQATK